MAPLLILINKEDRPPMKKKFSVTVSKPQIRDFCRIKRQVGICSGGGVTGEYNCNLKAITSKGKLYLIHGSCYKPVCNKIHQVVSVPEMVDWDHSSQLEVTPHHPALTHAHDELLLL